ncbi:AbrB/MazE/SpoVT family DNA-binding domain-containing protein [Pediococcus ethanolidurans]|uniref:AbrB/MazE/SpoVT family DNA-binding domain-containing protein n=1 Tax=Pediococcus ethanolidurans TaxID=319653 RepID=UPI001C1F10CD|nr:AbrB/MazE/SpoVT family DNA-binding domain-containing protein [Pediococcus ethanolidurans]MBU7563503.1 AbrB/MazE/SpoVT family DNA-binding domain-containing protein [Pediococcus ethanolidurans]
MATIISKSSKLSSQGQVVIPADIRKKMNLNSGDKLNFKIDNFGQLTINKLPTDNDWQKLIAEIPVEKVVKDKDGKVDAKKSPDFAAWMSGNDNDY